MRELAWPLNALVLRPDVSDSVLYMLDERSLLLQSIFHVQIINK